MSSGGGPALPRDARQGDAVSGARARQAAAARAQASRGGRSNRSTRTKLLKLDVGWSGGMSICLIDPARAAQIFIQNLHHGLSAGRSASCRASAAGGCEPCSPSAAARGLRRSKQLLRQAERWIAGTDDPNLLALSHMVSGLAAYASGRWPESLKLTDQSSKLFRDRGSGMTISLELADYYSLRRSAGWESSWSCAGAAGRCSRRPSSGRTSSR